MDKRGISLLAKAFEIEIRSAIEGLPRLMQTRQTAQADALVLGGMLSKCTEVWRGVTIQGYELTHLGRMTYCQTCEEKITKEYE